MLSKITVTCDLAFFSLELISFKLVYIGLSFFELHYIVVVIVHHLDIETRNIVGVGTQVLQTICNYNKIIDCLLNTGAFTSKIIVRLDLFIAIYGKNLS